MKTLSLIFLVTTIGFLAGCNSAKMQVSSYWKNHNKKYVVLDIPLLLENKVVKSSIIYVFVESKKKDIRYHLKKRKNFNKKLYNIVRLKVKLVIYARSSPRYRNNWSIYQRRP